MTEITEIEHAIAFATEHFTGMTDISGEPAILHSLRVGMALHTERRAPYVVAAGFLHDVVEDTDIITDDIYDIFGSDIGELVFHLTHREDTKYFDYIREIMEGPPMTRFVKMADIRDNMMNPMRIMDKYGLYKRWAKAYHILSGEADEGQG